MILDKITTQQVRNTVQKHSLRANKLHTEYDNFTKQNMTYIINKRMAQTRHHGKKASSQIQGFFKDGVTGTSAFNDWVESQQTFKPTIQKKSQKINYEKLMKQPLNQRILKKLKIKEDNQENYHVKIQPKQVSKKHQFEQILLSSIKKKQILQYFKKFISENIKGNIQRQTKDDRGVGLAQNLLKIDDKFYKDEKTLEKICSTYNLSIPYFLKGIFDPTDLQYHANPETGSQNIDEKEKLTAKKAAELFLNFREEYQSRFKKKEIDLIFLKSEKQAANEVLEIQEQKKDAFQKIFRQRLKHQIKISAQELDYLMVSIFEQCSRQQIQKYRGNKRKNEVFRLVQKQMQQTQSHSHKFRRQKNLFTNVQTKRWERKNKKRLMDSAKSAQRKYFEEKSKQSSLKQEELGVKMDEKLHQRYYKLSSRFFIKKNRSKTVKKRKQIRESDQKVFLRLHNFSKRLYTNQKSQSGRQIQKIQKFSKGLDRIKRKCHDGDLPKVGQHRKLKVFQQIQRFKAQLADFLTRKVQNKNRMYEILVKNK